MNEPLTAEERSIYEWQMRVDGVGEAGQAKLKGASVLISRCGGLGGMVAYELAAAGVVLTMNLATMQIRQVKVARYARCPVCAGII